MLAAVIVMGAVIIHLATVIVVVGRIVLSLSVSRALLTRSYFRLHLLSKLLVLTVRHAVPLLSGIGVVEAAVPTEHTAGAHLIAGSGKCLAKRC